VFHEGETAAPGAGYGLENWRSSAYITANPYSLVINGGHGTLHPLFFILDTILLTCYPAHMLHPKLPWYFPKQWRGSSGGCVISRAGADALFAVPRGM